MAGMSARIAQLPKPQRLGLEILITGLIVFALALSMVGLHVKDVPGGVALEARAWDVVVAAVIAMLGRLALILLRERKPLPVLFAGLPITAFLVAELLSETLFGKGSSLDVKALLPFDSAVVQWSLTAFVAILTIRAGLAMRAGGRAVIVEDRDSVMDRIGAGVQHYARFIGPIMFGLAIIWPFMPFVDRQVLDISILVLTYVMLGWGLNIVVGLAGLLDLGYVAFYAVGAYSYALLATTAGVSFWVALPFAGMMAAAAGVMLGFPVLRLRGDYLAIVTLGFGEMVRVILLNWYSLTNGPDGISKIPPASFFGLSFKTIYDDDLNKSSAFHTYFNLEFSATDKFIFLYFIILMLALITNIFTMRVRRLPIGRAWEALREDEIASRSLGINPRNTKLTAFGIGAMFSGFAGSFFATRQTFISPESFTFIESAIILAIVVLGGFGSQFGVVIASFILIGLPEIFRDLQQYRMLFFGLSMVVIMLWRPAGLLAHREPTIRLHPKNYDPSGDPSGGTS
jgi:branched-chain amino acid transport system permease protein